ncbi:MAG: hypothetical protein WBR18_13305 [Anaerolineales bacterium]
MLMLLKFLYRLLSKQAMKAILEGRLKERGHPAAGRFLPSEVRTIHRQAWAEVEGLLPQVQLSEVPTWGNRHNVFLAVLSVAMYHALLERGVDRDYAIELFADVGWKLYVKFLVVPKAIARLRTPDPQEQMNLVLQMLLRFPFNAPGRPGYEVKGYSVGRSKFITDWTYCPPFDYVKQYVEKHGDRGEVQAFFRSWCQYDWALAYAIAEGTGQPGWYQRPHALSQGDDICDMTWSVQQPADESAERLPA